MNQCAKATCAEGHLKMPSPEAPKLTARIWARRTRPWLPVHGTRPAARVEILPTGTCNPSVHRQQSAYVPHSMQGLIPG